VCVSDARCCTRQSKWPKLAELCNAIAMHVAASPTVDFVRNEDTSVEVREAERRTEVMSEDLAGKNEEITAEPTQIRNFIERFEPLVLVYASVLHALSPAAPTYDSPSYDSPSYLVRPHTSAKPISHALTARSLAAPFVRAAGQVSLESRGDARRGDCGERQGR